MRGDGEMPKAKQHQGHVCPHGQINKQACPKVKLAHNEQGGWGRYD